MQGIYKFEMETNWKADMLSSEFLMMPFCRPSFLLGKEFCPLHQAPNSSIYLATIIRNSEACQSSEWHRCICKQPHAQLGCGNKCLAGWHLSTVSLISEITRQNTMAACHGLVAVKFPGLGFVLIKPLGSTRTHTKRGREIRLGLSESYSHTESMELSMVCSFYLET